MLMFIVGNYALLQNELYVRYPISGSVYECFKNSNRGMPEEFRLRKRKTPAAATTTAATPETEPEPVPPQKLPETYEALGKDNNLHSKIIHWHLFSSFSLVEVAKFKSS